MTIWIPVAVAVISLLGVIFVPVFTHKRTQKLTTAQYEALQRKAREYADEREDRLRTRWQHTSDDVDYLWEIYQDEIVPWMRAAYEYIKPGNPDFPQPPSIKPRPAKEIRDQSDRERWTGDDFDR